MYFTATATSAITSSSSPRCMSNTLRANRRAASSIRIDYSDENQTLSLGASLSVFSWPGCALFARIDIHGVGVRSRTKDGGGGKQQKQRHARELPNKQPPRAPPGAAMGFDNIRGRKNHESSSSDAGAPRALSFHV